MAKIVYVSRSVGVPGGGGIGARVPAQAKLLAADHDVTVLTTSLNAEAIRGFAKTIPQVNWLTIDEPLDDPEEGFYSVLHHWSMLVHRRLSALFESEGAADYVEFPDYLGEAAVTIQARRTADPIFANTTIGVRLCTTHEMCHVLDGAMPGGIATSTIYDMERYSLANADWLIYPGGGDVLETFQRFYAPEELAPARPVRHVSLYEAAAHPLEPRDVDEPLRLLYVGRFERRKGIHNLASALAMSNIDDWHLTIVGGDTSTAPYGTSMRSLVEQTVLGDSRIELRDPIPHDQIGELMREHDAVVIPSIWELHPNVGIEALANNRPILATPVGGHFNLVVDGETGFLARGTSEADMLELVQMAIERREELAEMVTNGRPAARFRNISDHAEFCQDVEAAATAPARWDTPAGEAGELPLVSAVLPYFGLPEFVGEAVDSILDQDYENLETLIVNDGSFDPDDCVLAEISAIDTVRVLTTTNSGQSEARNFGASQTFGKYILLVDCDNTISTNFVSRAVAAMETDPEIAYVTSWLQFMDEELAPMHLPDGYHPLTNFAQTARFGTNVAGDTCAVVRRSAFESIGGYDPMFMSSEDRDFYLRLQRAGNYGQTIPEYFCQYRVRTEAHSKITRSPNLAQIQTEHDAALREFEMRWTKDEPQVPQKVGEEAALATANTKLAQANTRLEMTLAIALEPSVPVADTMLSRNAERLPELQSSLAEREATVAARQAELAASEGEIDELNLRIVRSDVTIELHSTALAVIHESPAWRYSRLLRLPAALWQRRPRRHAS